MNKQAAAKVTPVRQRSQYTCMATSMMMCLKANGVEGIDEDTVNKVMGAQPMRGASWENALACAQHFGMRATLTVPATLRQVKEWTDRGVPVMIAWNPEGRDWSHASVVFDVEETPQGGSFTVHVADPNIPDPERTVRVVTQEEFYHKWFEKWPDYLVRRPAMAVEREITQDGKQVVASQHASESERLAFRWLNKNTPPQEEVEPPVVKTVGHSQMVNQSFLNALAKRVGNKLKQMGRDFTLFLPHGEVDFLPSRPGWFHASWERGTDVFFDYFQLLRDMDIQPSARYAKAPTPVQMKKKVEVHKIHLDPSVSRDPAARALIDRGGKGGGSHHNREYDVTKGTSRKPKHPQRHDKEAVDQVVSRFLSSGAPQIQVEGRNVTVNIEFIKRLQRLDPSSFAVGTPRGGYTWATSDDSTGDFYFSPRKDLSGEFVEGWYVVSYTPGYLGRLTQIAGSLGARLQRTAGYEGNPDGKDIYPNEINHGYEEPLAGGTDVMRRLQNQLIHEQGDVIPQRPESPRLASYRKVPVERRGVE